MAKVGPFNISMDAKNAINAEPDIEFHESVGSKDVFGYVVEMYEECLERHKPRKIIWQKNRKAYEGADHDIWGGAATVSENKENDKEVYNSTLVANEIDDLVAIEDEGNPRIYPMPAVNMKGFLDNSEPWIVELLSPEFGGTGYMTPQEIVTKYWEVCLEDWMERNGYNVEQNKLKTDARIDGAAFTEQYIVFDPEMQEFDVRSDIVAAKHIMFDPAAKHIKDAKYIFQEKFMRVWEARKRWPKHRKKIHATEGEKETAKEGGDSGKDNDYKNMVKIVVSYWRDNTTKTDYQDIEQQDPETGEIITAKTPIEVPKYPTGRVIIFVPDLNILLEDTDSKSPFTWFPYNSLVPTGTSKSIYGKAVATPLRALQAMESLFMQQATINVKENSSTQVYIREGSAVNKDKWTSRNVEIREIRGSMASVHIDGAKPAIGDIGQMLAIIDQKAKRITRIFEPSRGESPSAGTSGRAILALQAGTKQTLGPSTEAGRLSQIRAGKQIFDLMRLTHKKGRRIRVKEEDEIPPVLPFDFLEVTASVDCEIGDDTHFPVDPIGRLEFVSLLMQMKDGYGVPVIDAPFVHDVLKIRGKKKLEQRLQQMREAVAAQNAQGNQGTKGNAEIGRDNNPAGPKITQREKAVAAAAPARPS